MLDINCDHSGFLCFGLLNACLVLKEDDPPKDTAGRLTKSVFCRRKEKADSMASGNGATLEWSSTKKTKE
ncbi:MAG: hypothetical protein J5803_06180 [Desulfovibrio sp.]|nr:hypothetical protein [Desulfovibrio sp.]